ncbi:required for S-phase initiation or completion [Scheffersomyces coipomensis]|uniref:required for S-phase initiation or completion n=1 Tax=Scheffersomyces coipomensis TaxID=1788519 RepID=UPI00315DDF5F
MDDPRYEDEVNSEDALTEDETDALADLQKEFELRAQDIREKYEQSRKQKTHNPMLFENDEKKRRVEVSGTPPPSPKGKEKPKPIYKTSAHDDIDDSTPISMPKKPEVKPSNFIQNLEDMSFKMRAAKAMSVDYSLRKFSFEDYHTIVPGNSEVNEIEPVSHIKLRKRFIQNDTMKSIVKKTDPAMKFLNVAKFLAKSNNTNNYEEPPYSNWCFMGIIINKSDPMNTKVREDESHKYKNQQSSKYMKLSVGDFNHTIDVYLFGKSFEEYWKLSVGSVVFILNPIISKVDSIKGYMSKVNGVGFTLKLDDNSVGSILEMGIAKSLGYCTYSTQECRTVIDISKTDVCDFHYDLKFRKSSSKRMELNGSVQMKSPQKVKQSVYMGKGGTSNDAYRTFLVDSTPTYKNEGGKLDKSLYFDSNILDYQGKKRKFQDERANKSLEKKLSKLGQSSQMISNLKLFKNAKPSAPPTIEKEKAFSNVMIQDLGFDPTYSESTELQRSKGKEVKRLQELNQISLDKSKDRNLTSSTEDIQSKKMKWKENFHTLKDYKQSMTNKLGGRYINAVDNVKSKKQFLLSPKRHKKNKVQDDEEMINSDDDDDDIDIDFGSEATRKAYEKIKG